MEIHPFTDCDLSTLHLVQPKDWDDISPNFIFYTTTDFCFPIKATVNKKLVGIGALILNRNTAWLAHIVVHPLYQRRGIGFAITQKLVEMANQKNCSTISLTATALGQRVYTKFGFEVEDTYVLLNGPAIDSSLDTIDGESPIQRLNDVTELHALDLYFSGEDRRDLLKRKSASGLVYRNDQGVIEGYYLPNFGDGLVNGCNSHVGFQLLKRRCAKEATKIGLPQSNSAGVNFLLDHGFVEYGSHPRMRLGKKLDHKPQFTFSRTGGDFG